MLCSNIYKFMIYALVLFLHQVVGKFSWYISLDLLFPISGNILCTQSDQLFSCSITSEEFQGKVHE